MIENKTLVVLGVLSCCVAGCSPNVEPRTNDMPESWSIKNPESTSLGQAAAAIAAKHADAFGLSAAGSRKGRLVVANDSCGRGREEHRRSVLSLERR